MEQEIRLTSWLPRIGNVAAGVLPSEQWPVQVLTADWNDATGLIVFVRSQQY